MENGSRKLNNQVWAPGGDNRTNWGGAIIKEIIENLLSW